MHLSSSGAGVNIELRGSGSGGGTPMTETEMQEGTSTQSRSISPALLKEAVEYHAVHSDWDEAVTNAPGYIYNKPTIAKYWDSDHIGYEISGLFERTVEGITGVSLAYYDPVEEEEQDIFFPDGPGVKDALRMLISVIYPVGSYYETSDADFDPSTAWGGTWEYADGKWHRTA